MRVVVIGAGRQGPAAAFDLAVRGACEVTIADLDLGLAARAAGTVNSLQQAVAVSATSVDASDRQGLVHFLRDFDLAVAAAPYRLNPNVCHAGIDASCHVVDMGVDTPDALEIHARNEEARSKGVSVVTDCGIAPGTVNVLAMALLLELPDAETVQLYCGGLPESAEPPFFHKVGFSVDSLIGEYVDEVDSLIEGKITRTEPLEGLEDLSFPGIGQLEAATTSGGTGTAPYSLEGRLEKYEYKTLRYPGHWQVMRFLRDAGFWDKQTTEGCSPRSVTLGLMERHMVDPAAKDIVVSRVIATGPSGILGYDLIDRFDPVLGFSAMQRTTGFSAAIVALEVISGTVALGCRGCESAVDPHKYLQRLAEREIDVQRTHTFGPESSTLGTCECVKTSDIS